ncbi:unnamed protein product [Rangifer tarandus platyrhynchus]|uniref:Uncharacterized protein n=1 Tax=Rangifer tarandus platyrhynchus TaxID=3082113 RepID=A0AC59Y6K1_RANTA
MEHALATRDPTCALQWPRSRKRQAAPPSRFRLAVAMLPASQLKAVARRELRERVLGRVRGGASACGW